MRRLCKATKIYRRGGIQLLAYRTYHHLFPDLLKYLFHTILFYVVGVFTSLYPRDEEVAVFVNVSQEDFSDNTKYLHLHLYEKEDVQPIWVTKSEQTVADLRSNGKEAYLSQSLPGRWHLLRAKYVFFDGRMTRYKWMYTGGAVRCQLRHGIPLKAPFLERCSALQDFLWKITRRYDYVVVNSEKDLQHCIEQYRTDPYGVGCLKPAFETGQVLETGFPRTDVFYRDFDGTAINLPAQTTQTFESLQEYETVIGYFPTMRHGRDSISPFKETEMNAFLSAQNAALVIKPHRGLSVEYADRGGMADVYHLPAYGDVYPYLTEIDVLITDYSSIAFDFSLTGGTVAFYPFDREEYTAKRGLHPRYDELVNEEILANNHDELLSTLSALLANESQLSQFTSFFEYQDGNSCERIAAATLRD